MATDKKQIQNIKTNIERTIQGLTTAPREFTYRESGGFVRNNMTYSIYYTLSKDEIYLTGLTKLLGSTFHKTGEMKIQFKRTVSYLTTQHGINKQATTPLLIPLELELEIDGIGGIYPGNSYHSTYVPTRYQNNTVFQCFDVNHRLDSSGWTVTLAGKMRATMDNIFDGFKKLEELQGEQFENYVNKAINSENFQAALNEYHLKYIQFEEDIRPLSGNEKIEARAKFNKDNPRPTQ